MISIESGREYDSVLALMRVLEGFNIKDAPQAMSDVVEGFDYEYGECSGCYERKCDCRCNDYYSDRYDDYDYYKDEKDETSKESVDATNDSKSANISEVSLHTDEVESN